MNHVNEKMRRIFWEEIRQQGGLSMIPLSPQGACEGEVTLHSGDPPSPLTLQKHGRCSERTTRHVPNHPSNGIRRGFFSFPAMVSHCFTLFLSVLFSYFGRDCVCYNVYFFACVIEKFKFRKNAFSPLSSPLFSSVFSTFLSRCHPHV